MGKKNRRSARQQAIVGGAVIFACRCTMAGSTFINTSTASWRFDPDTSGGSDLKTLNLTPPPPSSSMPAPPNYQFSKTFASGSSNSVAKGSIGIVTNQTTATFTLAPGTGVTQSDPGNAVYKGDSLLRINFDGLYKATSPSFGPPATGYVSVAVGGIVGTGGSAHFTAQVNYLSADGSTQLRPTVNFDKAFTSAGTFAQTFTSSSGLNPLTLATNTQFRVRGFFEFRASNHGKPSQINPMDVEAGTAPQTATWNVNNNGIWADPANWAAPQGTIVEDLGLTPLKNENGESQSISALSSPAISSNAPSIPTVPNGIGQRARFTSTLSGPHTITLAAQVTLGALDFGNSGNLNFTTSHGGFVMDTNNAGNASIQSRDTGGSKTNVFNTKLKLLQDLDINVEGTYTPGDPRQSPVANLYFKKNIYGDQGVNKNGNGNAFLNSLNSYTGGTDITGGKLSANITGALGTGSVNVNDAQLNYNALHAAKIGTTVQASNGGQIDLGVVPATDEQFAVNRLSAISGSAAELSSLALTPASESKAAATSAKTGATLSIADGAMLAHESFDTAGNGNPANLGIVPKYVFGISNDFSSPRRARSITVGNGSGTPWIGFGSDRSERTFGSNRYSFNDQIRVQGAGSLVALNQTLWLNAKLVSLGNNAVLDKYGDGVVSIENKRNSFRGAIHVVEGGLLVNGTLPKVQNISVDDGASLGGYGVIDGPVTVGAGASINPGSIKQARRVGTLTTGDLELGNDSELNFDLDQPPTKKSSQNNDMLDVNGDLFLDGTLNINDLGNFNVGKYTLIHFDGNVSGPGLDVGSKPSDQFNYAVSVVGHDVLLNVMAISPLAAARKAVPEPGSFTILLANGLIGALFLRARR